MGVPVAQLGEVGAVERVLIWFDPLGVVEEPPLAGGLRVRRGGSGCALPVASASSPVASMATGVTRCLTVRYMLLIRPSAAVAVIWTIPALAPAVYVPAAPVPVTVPPPEVTLQVAVPASPSPVAVKVRVVSARSVAVGG